MGIRLPCRFEHCSLWILMAERLIADKSVGGKKTSSNAKCLPFPGITFPTAVLRAQRQLEASIATLRHRLSYQLIARLEQCPAEEGQAQSFPCDGVRLG